MTRNGDRHSSSSAEFFEVYSQDASPGHTSEGDTGAVDGEGFVQRLTEIWITPVAERER